MARLIYLLDTNAWIDTLKGRSSHLIAHLGHVNPENVALCSIVKAELMRGAYRYSNSTARLALLQTLFSRHQSIAFDDAAAGTYALIRHALETQGRPIGAMDMLIAAIAVSRDLILVTHNRGEFERVPGLVVEDWTQPTSAPLD